MNWLYNILSPRNELESIEAMLVHRLPEFLYTSVPDIAFPEPTTSELLNNLIRHDFIIHPSTGNVMTAWDVNKVVKDNLKTISHNMALESQVVEKIKPILTRGLLPEYQSPGWARFLRYL